MEAIYAEKISDIITAPSSEQAPIDIEGIKDKWPNISNNQIEELKELLSKYAENEVYVEPIRINDIRFINKHFHAINEKSRLGDMYIVNVQTLQYWREKRKIRQVPFIGGIVRFTDFVFLRLAPKVWGIKKIYFLLTKGKGRLLSKAEVLGRLVSSGFEIEQLIPLEDSYLIAVKKVKPPIEIKPSYGPLFKMNRVGKGGKIIGVYKFRTMHPYSEFLQDYLIQHHGYAENGKIKDDFRMTLWAKRMRKYWIDELPQLLNVLKGDMKLVGVRPVSKVYFDQLPEELKKKRSRFKPGCIPPYVAFNKKSSLESVLECEDMYLDMKIKNPYFTDTKLFFKAIINIVFKGKRSA